MKQSSRRARPAQARADLAQPEGRGLLVGEEVGLVRLRRGGPLDLQRPPHQQASLDSRHRGLGVLAAAHEDKRKALQRAAAGEAREGREGPPRQLECYSTQRAALAAARHQQPSARLLPYRPPGCRPHPARPLLAQRDVAVDGAVGLEEGAQVGVAHLLGQVEDEELAVVGLCGLRRRALRRVGRAVLQ